MFLTDQVRFSYFGRGTFSDYLYQISVSSDHRFHMYKRRFFKVFVITNSHAPGGHALTKYFFSYFYRGSPIITISVKLLSILTIGFLAAMFLMDRNSF